MPPIRNQLLRRHQRAVRVPARHDHEEDRVEMAFNAQDVHREVNVVNQQHYVRLQPFVLVFMELLNLLAHRVPRVCVQWFMDTDA
ncbi:hypothetical protein K435DRAFT_787451 [Dendrothele bispora CBS 962.96]|uniref:Uncharacterized protein n=1 Tax=Dendrothele bispora (strain CBS 962.96) TaxID=1314807 RepID=A0A4V4HAM3_DENBC|nr:hypothetical protein K435DRAFT_787451 [Dendrothele bispora CBS 962.96]